MIKENNKILLFGLGSEILTDDGVGAKMVKQLQKELPQESFNFVTEFIFTLDSLSNIKGYNTVVFFDATITKNRKPGEISIATLENFEETLHLSNVHEIGFLEYFKTWKNLGIDIPKNIFIISIEIECYLKFGDKLSDKVSEKLSKNIKQIIKWLLKLGKLNNQASQSYILEINFATR
jgi:hydrogenase maturation protease